LPAALAMHSLWQQASTTVPSSIASGHTLQTSSCEDKQQAHALAASLILREQQIIGMKATIQHISKYINKIDLCSVSLLFFKCLATMHHETTTP